MNNQNGMEWMDDALNDDFNWMDDALEHHGVDGQQWGKRHGPPYPLSGSDKAQARAAHKKRKAELRKEREVKKVQKRIAKEQKKTERNEKRQAKEQKKLSKEKAKYAKSPKEVYKHRELYSIEEIQAIVNRFEWEDKVKNYMDKDYTHSKNQFESLASKSKSMASMAKNSIESYNAVVAVVNHLGGSMRPINIKAKNDNNQNRNRNRDDDD